MKVRIALIAILCSLSLAQAAVEPVLLSVTFDRFGRHTGGDAPEFLVPTGKILLIEHLYLENLATLKLKKGANTIELPFVSTFDSNRSVNVLSKDFEPSLKVASGITVVAGGYGLNNFESVVTICGMLVDASDVYIGSRLSQPSVVNGEAVVTVSTVRPRPNDLVIEKTGEVDGQWAKAEDAVILPTSNPHRQIAKVPFDEASLFLRSRTGGSK